ncbi:hypothetical protein EB796_023178 [Bugula neritina]|nr:hypothetical protein EB796_023178 [Bugula neritina]
MKATGKESKPCTFSFGDEDGDDSDDSDAEEKAKAGCLAAPRMFLESTQVNKYQLRAYIYQARSLMAADDNARSGTLLSLSSFSH